MVNGVALVCTDYNTTTANTIGGLSALSNDQVEIIVYDTFSVFGGNVNADFTVSNGTPTAGTCRYQWGCHRWHYCAASKHGCIYHVVGKQQCTLMVVIKLMELPDRNGQCGWVSALDS